MWRNRGFVRYLAGFGLSLLGDQIWFVALVWAAARLDEPSQTSIVMAAGSIPRAVLILLGGTFADRWGALRITLISQRLRVAIMLGAAALALLIDVGFWPLAAIALLFGTVDAAHVPAAASLPPQLLPRASLPAGQGVVQTLERLATIAGAPVGGLIVAIGGLSLATAANALLFLGALVILRAIRLTVGGNGTADPHTDVTPVEHMGTWRSLYAGLRYVTTHDVLLPILVTVTMLNLAIAAPLNVGVALLAQTRGWGVSGFSAIIASFGLGAALGALAVVRYRPRRPPALIGLMWIVAGSLSVAALGAGLTLVISAICAFLLGLTSGPASALLLGLVQARAETAYLGRVMALVTFSALGLVPVSYALFGLLTSATTLTTAFVAFAAGDLVIALVALSFRSVRRARL